MFMNQQKIAINDPILKSDPSLLDKPRIETIKAYTQKLLRIHEYTDMFKLDGTSELFKILSYTYHLPLSLHAVMFLNTLQNFCDEEQQ